MKDYLSLKILDRLRFVFEKQGIDYQLMRKILQMKLLMDRRRSSNIMNVQNGKKDENYNYRVSYIFYVLYGLLFLILFFLPASIFTRMTLVISVFIFMVTSIMISDFSSVLLDTKDINILLTRPVGPETAGMSRIIHIFIYLFTMSAAFITPTFIAGIIKEGIFFAGILILDLFFILAAVIILTSLLYGFVLHIFSGERLKDIINYIQIVVAAFLPISYQFTGEMFELLGEEIVFTPSLWSYLLPPAWFAAPFQLILESDLSIHYILLSLLALLVPAAGLVLYNKKIIPYFERNLVKLNTGSRKRKGISSLRESLRRRIISLASCKKSERAFLSLYWSILSQSRKVKLSVYPNLVFSLIFPLIFIKDKIDFSSLSESLQALSAGNYYLYLYLSVLLLPNVITIISYSEEYKGAWIYKALPVDDYSIFNKARAKAVVLKYCLPVFLLIGILYTSLFGIRILDDLLLMFLVLLLLTVIRTINHRKELPFSLEITTVEKKSLKDNLHIFITPLLCGVFVVMHILLNYRELPLWPFAVLIFAGIILLWHSMLNEKNVEFYK